MATIQDVTKSIAFVECIHPVDVNANAQTGDYIHAKNYDQIAIVSYCGVEGAAAVVVIEQCTQDADGGADVKAFTVAKDITVTANTVQIAIIDGADFDADNDFQWVKVTIADPTAATVIGVMALGIRGRWAEATMPSMIT